MRGGFRMKKILALLMGTMLVISLISGCGENEEETAASASSGEGGEGELVTDFGGETIVVGLYCGDDSVAGKERIFEKVNEYYMENYNIDVQFVTALMADYPQSMNMMLSSGEQLDIFCSGMLGFSNTVANESTYDLYQDGLIDNYGKDILELVDPVFLRGCVVDGALCGIPCMRDLATGMWCIVFDKSYLDGIGYDYSDIDPEACNPATIEEMTDLFAQLHEAYPDVNVIYPWGYQYLNQKFLYDPIGGDNFGVLLDPANSLEVSNLFTSDMFREYCELMYEWQQAGYISKDAATETQSGGAQIIAGTLMSDTTGGKPGIVRQKEVERGDRDSIAFQLGENFVRGEAASTAAWSINSNTESPEAAMVVLNDLYTSPTVTNLLLWGEEGVDYVLTEDGHATFPEGINEDNADYYNMLPAWALPCEYTTHVWVGDDIDLWEQTIEFNNTALKSKALGFSFDSSEVSTEYTALTNVWLEYANGLLFGMIDPAVGIPELNERLEAAGLETYIEAKTEALNEWAAENGIE